MNIYRGTASGGETLLRLDQGSATGTYVDNTVQAGTTYYYYVTALNHTLDGLSEESAPSNESSPASGGGAFEWTGAGADDKWTTGANWLGGSVALRPGNGNETLIFPELRLPVDQSRQFAGRQQCLRGHRHKRRRLQHHAEQSSRTRFRRDIVVRGRDRDDQRRPSRRRNLPAGQ